MREVDLRRIDLNLLAVLDALLRERGVTRAALRLGMSQPAASRALARLRVLFADALLVEGPGGYVLTARAEEMLPRLRNLLADIGNLLDERSFDPAKANGSVRLLMLDLEAAVLGPPLVARLTDSAPDLDLEFVPPGRHPLALLENNTVDGLVGVVDDAPAGIRIRKLYDDRFVTVMRAAHPAAATGLTLERYLELEHMIVSVTGTGRSWVDEVLARAGAERRVRVRVPSFFAAIEIAARSDLIMTLPSRLARTAADMKRFAIVPPPLDMGRVTMSLAWHARHQDSPRHAWLRGMIVDTLPAG